MSEFYLFHTSGWRGRIKNNKNDWEFHSHKGTNLGYDMLCESVNSDQEEKEVDLLNGNRIINLKKLIINIDNCLLRKKCAQEKAPQIESDEGKEQENIVDYVDTYFQLTPSDEQKGIRDLHQDFKKQTPNNQIFSHQDLFCMNIYKHSNGISSTIDFRCNRRKKDKRLSNHNLPLHLPQQTKHHSGDP